MESNMERESVTGIMGESTRDNSRMIRETDSAPILTLTEPRRLASGRMANSKV